jgi:hypothetical protein
VCLFAFAEPDRRLHGVRLAFPNGKPGEEVDDRADAGQRHSDHGHPARCPHAATLSTGDKIVEVWLFSIDQQAEDAFWDADRGR